MSKLLSNKKLFVSLILLVVAVLIGIITGSIAVGAKHSEGLITLSVQDIATGKINDNTPDAEKALHAFAMLGYFGGIFVLITTFAGGAFFGILIALGYKGKGGNILQIAILVFVILFLLFIFGLGASTAYASTHVVDPEWSMNFIDTYNDNNNTSSSGSSSF